MTITAITGKVGSGKNLYAMSVIERYAWQGRRVVCNFRCDMEPSRTFVQRLMGKPAPTIEQLPGRPTYEDICDLKKGGPGEHRSGLLVLDECGPLFNSRTWQDKSRGSVIDWFLHSRKLAWDVILIVQSMHLLDKQIRTSVIEMAVTVKRLDKLRFLGLPLPRVHLAIERYGCEANAPRASWTTFRGNRYFKMYDTTELVGDLREVESVEAGGGDGAAQSVPSQPLVPAGVRTCTFPEPRDSLSLAWMEISQSLGLACSVLPADYFQRSASGSVAS